MNDLASNIFNTANAMNRAKAAELSGHDSGRTAAVHSEQASIVPTCEHDLEPRKLTQSEAGWTPAASTPKGRWATPSDNAGCDQCGTNDREPGSRLCRFCRETQRPDVAPHIAKIPLRAEVRDMLIAAKLYDEQADRCRNKAEGYADFVKYYHEEADRLEQLARDARAQSENLERMANL